MLKTQLNPRVGLKNHQTTQAHLTTRDELGPRAPVGAQLSAFFGDLTQLNHHVERGTARDVDPRNRCGLTVVGMESCQGAGGGGLCLQRVCVKVAHSPFAQGVGCGLRNS